MGTFHRARWALIPVGLVLCGVGVNIGLQKPNNGDSYCGQALWNGDTFQCEQLAGYGWRTGGFIALGLACIALSFRRWLVAAFAIAGIALVGVGVWRSFESPQVELRGRTCGNLVGIDPELFGIGVDDEYDIDRVADKQRDDCRGALLDQGAVVGAFVVLGGVLVALSRVLCSAVVMRSRASTRVFLTRRTQLPAERRVRVQWEYSAFPVWEYRADLYESELQISETLRSELQRWNDACEALAWGEDGPDVETGRDRAAERIAWEALNAEGVALTERLRAELGSDVLVEFRPQEMDEDV